jgi:hypothetical protein
MRALMVHNIKIAPKVCGEMREQMASRNYCSGFFQHSSGSHNTCHAVKNDGNAHRPYPVRHRDALAGMTFA